MENPEQPLQPGEKYDKINAILKGLHAQPELTYEAYKEAEGKINELQQGLDGQEIEKRFGEKMKAIWEKVKDKPE